MKKQNKIWKIGITDYIGPIMKIENDILGNNFQLEWINYEEKGWLDNSTLAELDGLMVWHASINQEVISKLKNVKLIVRYGVGFDNIDLNLLNKKNIIFSNTPDYGTEEVADTTIAMLLSQIRKINLYNCNARNYKNDWQENTIPGIKRSNLVNIGIIGVGRIGTSVIRRLKPFGFNIFGFDPYQPSGHEKAIGYRRVNSISEILKESEAISFHCPLTEETRGIINKNFIDKLKPGSIIINTARGDLINNLEDIKEGIKSNKISGIGLDVLPEEPPLNESLIVDWRNNEKYLEGKLLINPHTAYFSEESWVEMRSSAAKTIKIFFEEKIIRNRIV